MNSRVTVVCRGLKKCGQWLSLRVLIAFLCGSLAFPPQVWAQDTRDAVGAEKEDQTPAKKYADPASKLTPSERKGTSRESMVQAVDLALWGLTYYIKQNMEWLFKADLTLYYQFLRSYRGCADRNPFPNADITLKDVQALTTPAQEMIVAFLEARKSEIGSLHARFIEVSEIAPRKVVKAPNGALCQPSTFEVGSFSAAEWEKPEFAAEEHAFHKLYENNPLFLPVMNTVAHKPESDSLTSLEYRSQRYALYTIRRLVNLVSKQLVSVGKQTAYEPVKELTVTADVGQPLMAVQAYLDKPIIGTSTSDAAEVMSNSKKGKDTARFVPCSQKQKLCGVAPGRTLKDKLPLPADYCFCDPPPQLYGQFLPEQVIVDLNGKNPDPKKQDEPNYGAQLYAEIVAGASAQHLELAAAKSRVSSTIAAQYPIPSACLVGDLKEDLKDAREAHDYLAGVQTIAAKLKGFEDSLNRLKDGLAKGEYAFNLGSARTMISATAQDIVRRFIGSYVAMLSSKVVPNSAEWDNLKSLEAALNSISSEIPFLSVLEEGTQNAGGTDLAALITARLQLGFLLNYDEFSQLFADKSPGAAEKIQARVKKAIEDEVVRPALEDSLRGYAMGLLHDREDDGKESGVPSPVKRNEAESHWLKVTNSGRQSAQDEWNSYLTNELSGKNAISELASQIVSFLTFEAGSGFVADKDHEAFEDSVKSARALMERSKQVIGADQTIIYMDGLKKTMEGPGGALPYFAPQWSHAGASYDTTYSSAWFRVANGSGHENLYPLFTLDPTQATDHYHLQKGLNGVFSRAIPELEAKLKKATPKRDAFTDENVSVFTHQVRIEGGPDRGKFETVKVKDVKTLAGRVVMKASEILDAESAKEPLARSIKRKQALESLKSYATSGHAKSTHYQRAKDLAKRLFERVLEPKLKVRPKPETKEWRDFFEQGINELHDSELLVAHSKANGTEYLVNENAVIAEYEKYESEKKKFDDFLENLKKSQEAIAHGKVLEGEKKKEEKTDATEDKPETAPAVVIGPPPAPSTPATASAAPEKDPMAEMETAKVAPKQTPEEKAKREKEEAELAAKGWTKFCLAEAKCKEWIEERFSPFQSPILDQAWKARHQGFLDDGLKSFLTTFGSNGAIFEGTAKIPATIEVEVSPIFSPVASRQGSVVIPRLPKGGVGSPASGGPSFGTSGFGVANLGIGGPGAPAPTKEKVENPLLVELKAIKDTLIRKSSYGMKPDFENDPDYKAIDLVVDAFLIDVSKRVHAKENKGKTIEFLVKALRPELEEKLKGLDLFTRWKARIESMKASLAAAAISKKESELVASFPTLRAIFGEELPHFAITTERVTTQWEKEKLHKALLPILIPQYSLVRDEVLDLIHDVTAEQYGSPAAVLAALKRQERDLEGKKFDLERNNKFLGEAKKQYERATNDIAKRRARAHRQLYNTLRLDKLVEIYYASTAAGQAVMDAQAQSMTTAIWQAYHRDQFYHATAVALPVSQILNDLNAVGGSRGLVPISQEEARKFLTEYKDFCRSALAKEDVFSAQYTSFVEEGIPNLEATVTDNEALPENERAKGDDAKKLKARAARVARLKRLVERYKTGKEFCEGIVTETSELLQTMAKEHEERGSLARNTAYRYWTLAQLHGDIFEGQLEDDQPTYFGPLPYVPDTSAGATPVVKPPTYAWFSTAPTLLFKKEPEKKSEEAKTGDSSEKTEALGEKIPEKDELKEAEKEREKVAKSAAKADSKAATAKSAPKKGEDKKKKSQQQPSDADVTDALIAFFSRPNLKSQALTEFTRVPEVSMDKRMALRSEKVEERIAGIYKMNVADRRLMFDLLWTYFSDFLLQPVDELNSAEYAKARSKDKSGRSKFEASVRDAQRVGLIQTPRETAWTQFTNPYYTGAPGAWPSDLKGPAANGKGTTVPPPPANLAVSLIPTTETLSEEALQAKKRQATGLVVTVEEKKIDDIKNDPTAPRKVAPSEFLVEEKRSLDYASWRKMMERLIVAWEGMDKDFTDNVESLQKDVKSEIDRKVPQGSQLISQQLLELFTRYTPHRVTNFNVSVPPIQTDEPSEQYQGRLSRLYISGLQEFENYSYYQKRHVVRQIISIWRMQERALMNIEDLEAVTKLAEQRSLRLASPPELVRAKREQVSPFLAGEHKFQSASEWEHSIPFQMMEIYATYFSPEGFHVDQSKKDWREFRDATELKRDDCFATDDNKFVYDWQPLGQKQNRAAQFEDWFEDLAADSVADSAYLARVLKKPPVTPAHLWEKFPTLADFRKSSEYTALIRIFEQSDKNSGVKVEEGTYPFFLALLNFDIANGEVPNPKFFANSPKVKTIGRALEEKHLAGLLPEFVEVVKLNLRDWAGWENLLFRYDQPQDWFAIAESKKMSLAGIGDSKMSKTWLPSPQREVPGWVYGEQKSPYRALPINASLLTDDTASLQATFFRPGAVNFYLTDLHVADAELIKFASLRGYSISAEEATMVANELRRFSQFAKVISAAQKEFASARGGEQAAATQKEKVEALLKAYRCVAETGIPVIRYGDAAAPDALRAGLTVLTECVEQKSATDEAKKRLTSIAQAAVDHAMWINSLQRPESYTVMRGNREDWDHQDLYYVLGSISASLPGEHTTHAGFQSVYSEMTEEGILTKPFGTKVSLADLDSAEWTDKLAAGATRPRTSVQDIRHFAALRGVFVSTAEVQAVSQVFEPVVDFVGRANAFVNRYPFENGGEIGISTGSASRLSQMLSTFASQKEIGYRGDLPEFSSWGDSPLTHSISQAMLMARWRVSAGRSVEEQARMAALFDVFIDYYRGIAGGIAYQESVQTRLIVNISQGLADYCAAGWVKNINSKEQFDLKRDDLEKLKIHQMDGLLDYLEKYSPNELGVKSAVMIGSIGRDLKAKQKLWANVEFGMQWLIAGAMVLSLVENPTVVSALARNSVFRFGMYASMAAMALFFTKTEYDSYISDYYGLPQATDELAQVTQRELVGFLPVASERTAEEVDQLQRAYLANQHSNWRWGWRVFNVLVTASMVSATAKALWMGPGQFVMRGIAPVTYLRARTFWLRRELGVTLKELEAMAPDQVWNHLTRLARQKAIQQMKAVPLRDGERFRLPEGLIRQDHLHNVDVAIQHMADELHYVYNPTTGGYFPKPIDSPTFGERTAGLLSDSLGWSRQRGQWIGGPTFRAGDIRSHIRTMRMKQGAQFDEMIDISRRLRAGGNGELSQNQLMLCQSLQSEVAGNLTPRLWFFTGMPAWLSPWGAGASFRLNGMLRLGGLNPFEGMSGVSRGFYAAAEIQRTAAFGQLKNWVIQNAGAFDRSLGWARENISASLTEEELVFRMLNRSSADYDRFNAFEETRFSADALKLDMADAGGAARNLGDPLSEARGLARAGRTIFGMLGFTDQQITRELCSNIVNFRWRKVARHLLNPPRAVRGANIAFDEAREEDREPWLTDPIPESERNAHMNPAKVGKPAKPRSAPKAPVTRAPILSGEEAALHQAQVEADNIFRIRLMRRVPENLRSRVQTNCGPFSETLPSATELLRLRKNAWNEAERLAKLGYADADPVLDVQALEWLAVRVRARELGIDWRRVDSDKLRKLLLLATVEADGKVALLDGVSWSLLDLPQMQSADAHEMFLGLFRSKFRGDDIAFRDAVAKRADALRTVIADCKIEQGSLLKPLEERLLTRIRQAQEGLTADIVPFRDPNAPFFWDSASQTVVRGALNPEQRISRFSDTVTSNKESFIHEVEGLFTTESEKRLARLALADGYQPRDFEAAINFWTGNTHVTQAERESIVRVYQDLTDFVLQRDAGFTPQRFSPDQHPFKLTVDGVALRAEQYRVLYGKMPEGQAFRLNSLTEAADLFGQKAAALSPRRAAQLKYELAHQIRRLRSWDRRLLAEQRLQVANDMLTFDIRQDGWFEGALERFFARGRNQEQGFKKWLVAELFHGAVSNAEILTRLRALRLSLVEEVGMGLRPAEQLLELDGLSILIKGRINTFCAERHGAENMGPILQLVETVARNSQIVQYNFSFDEAKVYVDRLLTEAGVEFRAEELETTRGLERVSHRLQKAYAEDSRGFSGLHMMTWVRAARTLQIFAKDNPIPSVLEVPLLNARNGALDLGLPAEITLNEAFVSNRGLNGYYTRTQDKEANLLEVLFARKEMLSDSEVGFVRSELLNQEAAAGRRHTRADQVKGAQSNFPGGPNKGLTDELYSRYQAAVSDYHAHGLEFSREHAAALRRAIDERLDAPMQVIRELDPLPPAPVKETPIPPSEIAPPANLNPAPASEKLPPPAQPEAPADIDPTGTTPQAE